jgi:hypothetical protein
MELQFDLEDAAGTAKTGVRSISYVPAGCGTRQGWSRGRFLGPATGDGGARSLCIDERRSDLSIAVRSREISPY